LHSDGSPWRFDKAPAADPALPRVLLVGDSILNGYLPAARNLLAGVASVDAWVNPLFQSDAYNKGLAVALANGPYAVIQINTGLHGWAQGRIPEGQFVPLTQAFVDVIHQKCPGAKVIWASSTPVTVKGTPTELDSAINPLIIEQNRLAAEVMKNAGIPVNDFYGSLVNQLSLARGDGFHWKTEAYKILAVTTADRVKELLSSK
ncbi:MAG: SGNH/GDSL hydrolase family protein, partial [Terrimicrobiaceae bacterium]